MADALKRGAFDIVILLTGVGTRVLLDVVQATSSRDEFVAALARNEVVPRGPKPLAVLRELKITPWVTVPEPNTWRELLTALDEKAGCSRRPSGLRARLGSLRGQRIAVGIPGKPNDELLRALEARGASVTSVPVYRWALPDDIEPLRGAVTAIVRGSSTLRSSRRAQIVHLMQVADLMGQSNARYGMRSGGWSSPPLDPAPKSCEIRESQRISRPHPKMGFLVREAAERSPDLLRLKRRT